MFISTKITHIVHISTIFDLGWGPGGHAGAPGLRPWPHEALPGAVRDFYGFPDHAIRPGRRHQLVLQDAPPWGGPRPA